MKKWKKRTSLTSLEQRDKDWNQIANQVVGSEKIETSLNVNNPRLEKSIWIMFAGTLALIFALYFMGFGIAISKKHNPTNIVNKYNNTYTISITNGNCIFYTDTNNLLNWTNLTTGANGQLNTNGFIILK